jgi:radical SAM superfamily enzyme YgiQ (UPF0313 family)
MKLLLLRPYYGITVHSDTHGDLGVSELSPNVFPDLPLVYAATIASQNKSVELDIIDANAEKLTPEETKKRIRNNYDHIVLKASAPTIKCDIEFAKYFKMRFPSAKIALAGHIAKILKQWIEKNISQIDEVIEIPIDVYVDKLVNRRNNTIQINEFPSPDYSLFPYNKYEHDSGNLLAFVNMSRGCAMGCNYCPYASFYGKRFEVRSPEKVIKDIEGILNLGISTIQFRDQYFTFNRKNVMDLCNMIINQKLEFNWICETRLESLDIQLIDLMVESGLKMVCFGIESASEEILKSNNRLPGNMEKIQELIEYLRKKQVKTLAFYIIGFPDDTWDTIKETYNLAIRLKSDYVKFAIYVPCVFTNNGDHVTTEINPDLFMPFENTMTINSSKHLTHGELEYLLNQLTITYHMQMGNLRYSYEYCFINQINYKYVVKKLKEKLENKTLI